jgi:hypothetical protein
MTGKLDRASQSAVEPIGQLRLIETHRAGEHCDIAYPGLQRRSDDLSYGQ